MELLHTLSKALGSINYRGCIIQQMKDGCYVWGKNRGNIQAAKQFIDQAYFSFNQ